MQIPDSVFILIEDNSASSFAQSIIFVELVRYVTQIHGFKRPPVGITVVGIPPLQAVKNGFKIFKFISVEMPSQHFDISPFVLFEAGHVFMTSVEGKAGL